MQVKSIADGSQGEISKFPKSWTQGSYGNGKTEFQDFRTFFIFQGLNFFPILYKTTRKMHFFQPETSKWKGALVFFDSDSSDKNRDYRTKLNRIENESHLALWRVSSDFHTVFCDFHTVFFVDLIDLKGLVF